MSLGVRIDILDLQLGGGDSIDCFLLFIHHDYILELHHISTIAFYSQSKKEIAHSHHAFTRSPWKESLKAINHPVMEMGRNWFTFPLSASGGAESPFKISGTTT